MDKEGGKRKTKKNKQNEKKKLFEFVAVSMAKKRGEKKKNRSLNSRKTEKGQHESSIRIRENFVRFFNSLSCHCRKFIGSCIHEERQWNRHSLKLR